MQKVLVSVIKQAASFLREHLVANERHYWTNVRYWRREFVCIISIFPHLDSLTFSLTILRYKGHFFFEWAKLFKTKFPKSTIFVLISLNFGNNWWNSRKYFFIVNMIGLDTWNSKIRSKDRKKWSFVFFIFENQFLWFKTKITFPAHIWYLKN